MLRETSFSLSFFERAEVNAAAAAAPTLELSTRLALASILGPFLYLLKFTLLTPFLHTFFFSLLLLGSHPGSLMYYLGFILLEFPVWICDALHITTHECDCDNNAVFEVEEGNNPRRAPCELDINIECQRTSAKLTTKYWTQIRSWERLNLCSVQYYDVRE